VKQDWTVMSIDDSASKRDEKAWVLTFIFRSKESLIDLDIAIKDERSGLDAASAEVARLEIIHATEQETLGDHRRVLHELGGSTWVLATWREASESELAALFDRPNR
jgi:hypothetical protein